MAWSRKASRKKLHLNEVLTDERFDQADMIGGGLWGRRWGGSLEYERRIPIRGNSMGRHGCEAAWHITGPMSTPHGYWIGCLCIGGRENRRIRIILEVLIKPRSLGYDPVRMESY